MPRLPDSMRRRPELQGKISLLDASGPNRAKTDEAQRAYEIDQEDRRIRASKLPASMEKSGVEFINGRGYETEPYFPPSNGRVLKPVAACATCGSSDVPCRCPD